MKMKRKKSGRESRASAPKSSVPATTIKIFNFSNIQWRRLPSLNLELLEGITKQCKRDIVYATPGDSMPCNFVYKVLFMKS